MSSNLLLLTAGAGNSSVAGPLRGQFCIRGDYPYGPRPGRPDNVFFFGELDAVWRHDRATAERAKADYRRRGLSHLVCGPIYGESYSHHYADTDYRGAPDEYARFLRWWGGPFTLSVFPTHAPYYDKRGTWDLDLIERDFLPFYQHPEIQRLVKRTMFCYEEYGTTPHMAACFRLYRKMFPNARRYWHNPPGHLSPAMGYEGEDFGWVVAALNGIHGMYLQGHPIHETPPVVLIEGREVTLTPLQRVLYDVWDMQRRFKGSCPVPPLLAGLGLNPRTRWDTRIKTHEGLDLHLVYAEATAAAMYWAPHILEAECARTGATMLTVEGVTDALDGCPTRLLAA